MSDCFQYRVIFVVQFLRMNVRPAIPVLTMLLIRRYYPTRVEEELRLPPRYHVKLALKEFFLLVSHYPHL
jgi:hypothetical protein